MSDLDQVSNTNAGELVEVIDKKINVAGSLGT